MPRMKWTPEMKRRLSEAQKRRWAKRKAAIKRGLIPGPASSAAASDDGSSLNVKAMKIGDLILLRKRVDQELADRAVLQYQG